MGNAASGSLSCAVQPHRRAFAASAGIGPSPTAKRVTRRWTKSALRYYTGSSRYLRYLREGTPRIDLDGSPVGAVTAEEEQAVQVQLAKRKQPKLPAPVTMDGE
jgi:ProQ/FINO family